MSRCRRGNDRDWPLRRSGGRSGAVLVEAQSLKPDPDIFNENSYNIACLYGRIATDVNLGKASDAQAGVI